MQNNYDVVIIGTGSAGYPAGMYASRYKMKNIIIGGQPGGALATSHKVENFPGIISASGREIMNRFKEHAETAGSEILFEMVTKLEKLGENNFKITTSSGKEFFAKYVLLATGNSHRKLGVTGEREFLGKGVSYCATCDGMFFKGKDVIVVGGGNTALTESIYLSEICNKVYLVHRSDNFKAETVRVEQAKKRPNLEMILNEEVQEIVGDFMGMTGVKLKSGKELKADGIFVAIGTVPNTDLVKDLGINLDTDGSIIVDQKQETSLKGLYAAGDITTNSNKFKQSIMAAAEACLAANSIHEESMK